MKYKSLVAPAMGGLVSLAAVATAIFPLSGASATHILPALPPPPIAVPSDILGDVFSPARAALHGAIAGAKGFATSTAGGAAGLTVSTVGAAKSVVAGTLEGAHDAAELAAGTVDTVTDKAVPVVLSVPGTVAGKVDGVEVSVEPVVKSVPATVAGKVDGVTDEVVPVVASVPGQVQGVAGGAVSTVDAVVDSTKVVAGACPAGSVLATPVAGLGVSICTSVIAAGK